MSKSVQRMDQKLTNVNLAIFINIFLMLSTIVCSVFEDFIDVLVFVGVAF